MALTFSVVKRKIMSGEHAGEEMFFGHVKAGTKIEFDKLCRLAAHHSAVTHADVSVVLKEILTHVGEVLLEGDVVDFGRMGKFRLSAGSEGVSNEEDFTLRHMRRPRVIFTPGREIRNMLKNVRYVKEQVVVREVVTGLCPDHQRG